MFKRLYKVDNQLSSFAFFRIMTGVLSIVSVLIIRDDIHLFYSDDPIVPNDLLELKTREFIVTLPEIVAFVQDLGWVSFTFNHFILVFIGLNLLLIIGFCSRMSAILVLFSQIAIVKSAVIFSYGFDYFLSMSLFYCCIFPVGQNFSIDSLIWKYSKPNGIYLSIFRIHICIAYFFSGLFKALGYNWLNGESIWKAVHLPYVNTDFSIPLDWMADFPYLIIAIGVFTILIELLHPLLVSFRKTRDLCVMATILMHVGIAVILNLWLFSAIMITWNLTAYFLPESTNQKLARKVSLNVST